MIFLYSYWVLKTVALTWLKMTASETSRTPLIIFQSPSRISESSGICEMTAAGRRVSCLVCPCKAFLPVFSGSRTSQSTDRESHKVMQPEQNRDRK